MHLWSSLRNVTQSSKVLLFYSHSRLKLTWQGTRKPLGGLAVISVIASSTVRAVAVLRGAEQAWPRHSSPLGAERGEGNCCRWGCPAPGGASCCYWSPLPWVRKTCLSANTKEPLCGPGAWWLVLATGLALWHWGWAGGHRPGCHPPPGVPTHLGGSGRQGNHSTPGSVALCLPFFSFCFVRCSREVAGAELFTFEAKYFVRWRKWPLKWFVK